MKNHLILSAILLPAAVLLLGSCEKEVPQPAPVLTDKTIRFALSSSRDFSGPAYDHVTAVCTLSIARIDHATGAQQVEWDTILAARPLRAFPAPGTTQYIEKQVTGVDDANKAIRVSSVVTYNTAGQLQTVARGEAAGLGSVTFQLPVIF